MMMRLNKDAGELRERYIALYGSHVRYGSTLRLYNWMVYLEKQLVKLTGLSVNEVRANALEDYERIYC
jgi:hypothetical protein